MGDFLQAFSLKGKNALIVCPQNPYGREIVLGLYHAGANIYLTGNFGAGTSEKMFDAPETLKEAWQSELGIPVAGWFAYEHGSAEAAAALEQEVREQVESLDIVVENGLYTGMTGWTQSYEAICDGLTTTHLGMMLTVQALGRILADQGHGSVLLVADYGALVGYDVQKFADCPELFDSQFTLLKGFVSGGVVNYARQASNYLAEHGCRCNALAFSPLEGTCPEQFREAFVRHSQIKRMLTPEDVAAAAVFLASDASAFITGVTLPVDGGYTAK